jgi:hypothetical protein
MGLESTNPDGVTGSSQGRRPTGGEVLALLVMIAMAVYLVVLGVLSPSALKVPPAIAFLLGFALVMAAAALASRIAGRTRANALFAMLVLLGFAGTGGWIALAPTGPRSCVARVGSGESAGRAMGVSPTTCRVVFGSGAAISLAVACVAGLMAWRRDPA